MTRVASTLSKQLLGRRVDVKERRWWSTVWESTTLLPDLVQYSPSLPDGTIITEVQIQARPIEDHWVCEGILYLRVVGLGELSNQQVVDSEPLIRWAHWAQRWRYLMAGKFINERWPCRKIIHGSNRRLAWFSQAVDDYGLKIRVSVQYELS